MKNILLLLLLFFNFACTLNPQEITINSLSDTNIRSNHNKLKIAVIDKRENKSLIGKRAKFGGEITIKDSSQLPNILKQKILAKLDGTKNTNINIEVAINEIGHESGNSFMSNSFHLSFWCKMEVTIKNNSQKILYHKKYKFYNNRDYAFVTTAEENEKQANVAIDGVVEKMVSDDNLLQIIKTDK